MVYEENLESKLHVTYPLEVEKQKIVLCAAATALEQGPEKGASCIAEHESIKPFHYARLCIEKCHTMKDFKDNF